MAWPITPRALCKANAREHCEPFLGFNIHEKAPPSSQRSVPGCLNDSGRDERLCACRRPPRCCAFHTQKPVTFQRACNVQLIREFAANTPSPALKDAVFVPPGRGRLPRAREEPVERWGREHRVSELPVRAASFISPCGSAAECDPGTKRSLVRFPIRASARAVSLTPQPGVCRKQRMDDIPLSSMFPFLNASPCLSLKINRNLLKN